MFSNAFPVLLGWLIALAIFFGFIILLRYLHHKERMALIRQGIHPTTQRHNEDPQRQLRSRRMLRAGLIIAMVGLSLTVGLYPVGFYLPATLATPFHLGPWLLPGLIPLGVGIALIVSYYLEQNVQGTQSTNTSEDTSKENITPMKEHLDKKRHEM
jgi:formate hydrogenlyase subunit 3/multisubunit Na+/H+ antiporter MnhD subunit